MDGKCATGIGALVVINKDGWIITAAHIVQQFQDLIGQTKSYIDHEAKKAKIKASGLSAKEKKKELSKLGKLSPKHVTNCSAWWGGDGITVKQAIAIPAADLAIAQLEHFDPNSVSHYPVFKDPTKDFDPGVNLCKLGFPFHSITPDWDEAKDAFQLPKDALPVPFFPIDGIFTRTTEIVVAGKQRPFPLRWVETSSPGLRGQSGGPVVDTQGAIWAIQVNTAHFPLGFNPSVPGRPRDKVHQFLNVGRGVHSETILGFLRENKIEHEVSTY